MHHFWDDPESRVVCVDPTGDHILLPPSLMDLRVEEAWSRPIVVTAPRSLVVASLGQIARAMLGHSITVNPKPWPDPFADLPELKTGVDDLPDFPGADWTPPSTPEEIALGVEEERRLMWPHALKTRLAGVNTTIDYLRNFLSCTLLQLRGQLQVAPYIVTAVVPCDGRYDEPGLILLAEDASDAELGSAIRTALERARNP